MSNIGLTFGALAPKLKDQLLEQGFEFKNEEIGQRMQEYSDSLVRLLIGDILTDSQMHACRKKLMKRIAANCKQKVTP